MIHDVDVLPARGVEPLVPHLATIRRVVWETDDTYTIALDLDPSAAGYTFKPGQFNMLYVFGVGEAAISISSDPATSAVLTHTIHRVGSVTSSLAGHKRGDVIGLRGPYGSSWPLTPAQGRDVCVVAGGIGLAPLRPLFYSLFRERKRYGRIILLYGARSPLDLLYRVELEEWANRQHVEVIVTVDRSDTSWKGYVGVVTNLFSYIKLDAPSTVAYVCGPETMMKYTVAELERRGVGQGQVYISMERNMKCAVGSCGHCQYGPYFICKDGPVFPLPQVAHLLERKEL